MEESTLVPSTRELGREESSVDLINDLRFDLLASLDLLIRAQKVLKQEEGSYVSSLGRVPDVLGSIAAYYRVDIVRATNDRLLVVASAAPLGNLRRDDSFQNLMRDSLSIDESFRLKVNFPLPQPPAGYLRALAKSVLRKLNDREVLNSRSPPPQMQIDQWEGVFKGHFRYERKANSKSQIQYVAIAASKIAEHALGARSNILLESDDDKESESSLFHFMSYYKARSLAEFAAQYRLRQIYSAQKILFHESGRYSSRLRDVSSAWESLAALSSEESPLRMDEFVLDPNFGYQAEIAVFGENDQIRNLWLINGLGQISQTNPVEELMGRFEKARKTLEPHRSISSDSIHSRESGNIKFDKLSESGL